jgi:glycosyltransferase involved in cell wall biosynthesis
MPPLVSIVTVNLNDRAGLARTLASVARQSFTDRELIVVDGGSTDGSVDVIRESGALVTAWTSERDGGVYEAQNKGIARARGAYCLFLNSGDALASDEALARLLAGPPEEDIVYGDVLIEHPDGRHEPWTLPDRPTFELMMHRSLPHPATAIRRSVFERLGPYDTSLRIAADYELFLRAIVVEGVATRHVPHPIAVHARGGISSTQLELAAAERRMIQQRTLTPVLLEHWAQHVRATRPLLKKLRSPFRPLAVRVRSWSRRLRGRPDGQA